MLQSMASSMLLKEHVAQSMLNKADATKYGLAQSGNSSVTTTRLFSPLFPPPSFQHPANPYQKFPPPPKKMMSYVFVFNLPQNVCKVRRKVIYMIVFHFNLQTEVGTSKAHIFVCV